MNKTKILKSIDEKMKEISTLLGGPSEIQIVNGSHTEWKYTFDIIKELNEEITKLKIDYIFEVVKKL